MKYKHKKHNSPWFDKDHKYWVLKDIVTGNVSTIGTKRQLEIFYPDFKFIPYNENTVSYIKPKQI